VAISPTGTTSQKEGAAHTCAMTPSKSSESHESSMKAIAGHAAVEISVQSTKKGSCWKTSVPRRRFTIAITSVSTTAPSSNTLTAGPSGPPTVYAATAK
jgi:hypothetical protein